MKRVALALLMLVAALPAAAAATRDPVKAPLAAQRTIPDSARFDQLVGRGSLVQMTVTNYGFYGNNFFSREPSLEYPANRGYEHMVRGGLWIGAQAQDVSEFTGVTTGTVDAAQGPTSPEGSEFTPSGKEILQRSTLINNDFYSRDAVSEMDVISDFDDLSPTRAASNSEDHRPLKIKVHHENYQWGFAEFQNILFFHITVQNVGAVMESVWVGIYTEFSSGFKGGYTNWPPSSGDPGGLGGWFNKKWIDYDPADSLVREHYCNGVPIPDGCLAARAPHWIGLRYLGSRGVLPDTASRRLTLQAWSWSPGNALRDQDRERYEIMSRGVIQTLGGDSLAPGTGDPVELFAVGPFPEVKHDQSVTVDYAIVGGAEPRDIQRNSRFAQFAYNHNYVLPVPPPSPRMFVVARDTALDLYWDKSSELAYDITSPNPYDFQGYRVNIGEDPDTLARAAQFDVAAGDTSGFNTGFGAVQIKNAGGNPDSVLLGGRYYHYKYSIGSLRNGFKYFVSVTAYDLGNSQIEPLESGFSQNRVIGIPGPAPGERPGIGVTVFPNPYRVEARWDEGQNVRDHYLWFANLPKNCYLKIFTLSGDMVFSKDFNGADYHGEGARGIFNPAQSLGQPVLSGTTFGWNMITTEGQAVATGLYLFSVEDRNGGKRQVGKFLIVKSDREGVR